jgi:hypothetical protein
LRLSQFWPSLVNSPSSLDIFGGDAPLDCLDWEGAQWWK